MADNRDAASADQTHQALRPLYDADQTARLLNIPKPTLYEHGRTNPEAFGVVRIGRRMMFKAPVIDQMVS